MLRFPHQIWDIGSKRMASGLQEVNNPDGLPRSTQAKQSKIDMYWKPVTIETVNYFVETN
jgi:hypothetical protein